MFIYSYLPSDTGNVECLDSYVATCAKMTALIEECDALQFVVAGDFNCNNASRLCRPFSTFMEEIIFMYLTVVDCLMSLMCPLMLMMQELLVLGLIMCCVRMM